MRTLLYVRKPVGQYNILLPAYFRQVFGVGWDIFYGLLAIASLIFVTWFKIDENFYFLLINSYFDLVIIFDASMSLFIRFYQSVQVIFVNRNIEGAFIAAWNILGFALDFFSCLPYIILVIFTPRYYLVCSYQIVCILRLIRLYTPRRQFLDKSKDIMQPWVEFSKRKSEIKI